MAISLLFGVLVSTVLTLIVIPLGTLSAGEESCRHIAINMGLLPDDTDTDAKYNVETQATKNENAKKWIKLVLRRKAEKAEKSMSVKTAKIAKKIVNTKIVKKVAKKVTKTVKSTKAKAKKVTSKKINTKGLLKKEDKNDV
jgi:hypothetical protein